MKSKLDLFVELGRTTDSIRNKRISNDYWKREDLILKSRETEREKKEKSLSMSSEKFHKCFSI